VKNNKILLVIIEVIVLGGGLFLLKGESTSPVVPKTDDVMKKVEETNKLVEKKVPTGLKSCTTEILANSGNCTTLPKEYV